MQLAFAHFLMLVFGSGVGRYGWFMAHNPERALRVFTFGIGPGFGRRFFIQWNRAAGWFFTAFGCLTMSAALILLACDLFTMVGRTGK